MLARTPDRKGAIEYLAASGAVPITIIERDGFCCIICFQLHSKDQFLSGRKKSGTSSGSSLSLKVPIGFKYFIRLTFQARPSHGLSVARTANNDLLATNHDYDVANLGSQMTSDGNLQGSQPPS